MGDDNEMLFLGGGKPQMWKNPKCGKTLNVGKHREGKIHVMRKRLKPNPHARLRSEVGFELGSTEVKRQERETLLSQPDSLNIGTLHVIC